MPVLLPKRQGVSQTVALAEAYAHAKAAEPGLITISIYHPTPADDPRALPSLTTRCPEMSEHDFKTVPLHATIASLAPKTGQVVV